MPVDRLERQQTVLEVLTLPGECNYRAEARPASRKFVSPGLQQSYYSLRSARCHTFPGILRRIEGQAVLSAV